MVVEHAITDEVRSARKSGCQRNSMKTKKRVLTDHLARDICSDQLEESWVVNTTRRQGCRVCPVFKDGRHGLELGRAGGVVRHGERGGGHRVYVCVGGGVCVNRTEG
jgi:hypothetical protein